MKRFICVLAAAVMLCGCVSKAGQTSAESDNYRNFYEIFVGGFYDADGDGMGDINGVTQKLDYLTETLGIDGIWLMPIGPSPSYHKYDVTDYMAIDPEYGTMEDFDALIEACNKRGVSLIIDLVLNHTSNLHPWFQSDKAGDYYMFYPEQGANRHSAGNGTYYYGNFGSHMPDLNLDNPEVREEIEEIVAFWLNKGVAGFRLDAPMHYYEQNAEKNADFLAWLEETCKKYNPNVYLVGEVWSDGGVILGHYKGIDSLFNFPFAQAQGALVNNMRSGRGFNLASRIESWQRDIREANPDAIDAPFLTNHDIARSSGMLMRDIKTMKMAAALYLLMPGSPFIYYGEEIGMTGSGRDENKRLPMLFSAADDAGRPNPPVGADQAQGLEQGVEEQLTDGDSLLRFYMEILALKKSYPEIARGTVTAIDTGDNRICAYSADWEGLSVIILHNLANEPIDFEIKNVIMSDALSAGGELPSYNDDILHLPPLSTALMKASPL
ncbi:MAG: alpha-amylase [Clostridiales bacterium]|jgi:alpha-amylase|nr:alpha-amylase [Clostridiales bacterium]